MKIRRADPTDRLLLSSLCVDVQNLHAQYHPELFKTHSDADFAVAFFDEALSDPTSTIFIAEEHGQALGYVFCKLIERTENDFTFALRYLHVDQISVRPAAQGRGVGKALLAQVDELARVLNVQRVQLDSWGFNTSAHAFFEQQGFEKFNHRFWKNL